jgi:hypothetical protein
VIYSKWRPVDGKYDYYESKGSVGLGDDMPLPPSPIVRSPIGVASVAIGRSPKGMRRHVGTGEMPVGSIMPTNQTALGLSLDKGTVIMGLAVLGAFAVGYSMRHDGHV